MAASTLKIPKAPVVKPIAKGTSTSKPDAPKTTVTPKNLSATLPKKATLYQRYTDPITGAKYQYVNGAWKMTSGATGIALGRLPLTTPKLTGSESTGSTIATPPTPPPTPAPRAPFNYADAYYAYPGYGESLMGINAQQGGIESKYGFTIRRDTSTTSPTRGGAYYKPKGADEGTGTILATISPVDGTYVYKDAEGKTYSAADLEIDVVTLKPGDPNYLKGAFGATAATSNLNLRKLGDAAAQSGVGSSGIRASMVTQEDAARAAREFDLTAQAGADLGATTAKYAELYRTIFDAIKGQAADYNAVPPPVVEPPAAVTPDAPAAVIPDAAAPNTNPNTQTGLVNGQALSSGPEGQFMGQANAIVAQRDAPYSSIKTSLLGLKRFNLTPQQIRWIDDWIKNNVPKPLSPAQKKVVADAKAKIAKGKGK